MTAIRPDDKSEQEATVKQLLRRVAKRKRPSQAFSVVRHGTETDANREFAADRYWNGTVWFVVTLLIFVIAYAICVKIDAI